jgi:hypothetical protein
MLAYYGKRGRAPGEYAGEQIAQTKSCLDDKSPFEGPNKPAKPAKYRVVKADLILHIRQHRGMGIYAVKTREDSKNIARR